MDLTLSRQFMAVSTYREDNRILVLPVVDCWGFHCETDRYFCSLKDERIIPGNIGRGVHDAFEFIEKTSRIDMTKAEQESGWHHDTKYATRTAFWKHNDRVSVSVSGGIIRIVPYVQAQKRALMWEPIDQCVMQLPAGASAEELGDAVMDAYAAIDEWKGTHDGRGASGTPDRVQDHWTGGKEKDMGVMTVSVNREGNRILFLPCVECWGMDRATDRFFRSLRGPDVTAGDIGGALLDAFSFVECTGPLELSLEEQENCWRHDTRYKTWRAFARNNDFVDVTYYEDRYYWVCAYPPRIGDDWGDEVWRGTVPAGASAEELGDAVMDAYGAVDEWKKAHGRRAGGREPVARSAALCDGGEVLLPGPGEGFAERTSAAGEVLLAFERTGRGGDPVASLYLAEAEWDAEADGGEAWDEWLERWEGDNGPARSVSREPCGEGPFTRRWEARNGSCLTVALLAPRPDGLAVMLSLDAARPGRRPKAVGRWEGELHRIARAATIRPGKTES